jgi:acyl transferase domain-containing protein
MASLLQSWVSDKQPDQDQLHDLSYTLAARRSLYNWRSAVVALDATELVDQLSRVKPTKATSSVPVITFVFTGQGAQWYAMGRELLLSSRTFRDSISKSSELLRGWGAPWLLNEELLKDDKHSRLNESELAQPATTAIQVALVDVLSGLGVVPQRVCGHSSGEIGAAYAAGALSHEAALEV